MALIQAREGTALADMKENVIVTGIPRGGTTLSTALLNNLENAICLSEPPWQARWFKNMKNADRLTERIIMDFKNKRRDIIENRAIKDFRNESGSPITNYYNNNRKDVRTLKEVTFQVDKEDFLLGMKHNAHYTSILPQILDTDFFSVIAIVRHPVPTIMSWKSLNIPVSNGRLPHAEPFWKELRDITSSNNKSILTLVKMYDLFCERYLSYDKAVHLLKYEDIIDDPHVFETITGLKYKEKMELANRNQNNLYNFSLADEIEKNIINHAPNALKLYPMQHDSFM
jgi:hypothetical protein